MLAGATPATADNVLLNSDGIWRTYYYSTVSARWTQVALGSPDASNVAIRPDSAVQYSRLAATPLSIRVMGEVPRTNRKVMIANQGVTFLSSGWPVDLTLKNTQLHTTPGWRVADVSANADTVQILVSGIWRKYYYDGTYWRKIALGTPISDLVTIAGGSAMLINRAAGAGSAILSQTRPLQLLK